MFGTGTCIGVVGGIRITAIVVTLTFLAARGCTPRAASVFGAERAPVRWPAASGGACREVRPVRPTGAQGRRWAEVEGKFEAMWSMALRALDDIKESVRPPLPCRAAV